MKIDNIYTSFSFSKSYKAKLINFLRNNTTIETGGNKVFDGTYNHLLHIPEEFAELIIELKKIHKKDKVFKNFLEIGFSHGIANTILNKFFNFSQIVAIDKFGAHINGATLLPNLRFKNLVLICGDSQNKTTINTLKNLGKFDLVFIDGDHEYSVVKNDFLNVKKMIHKKSVIIFHDINLDKSGSKKFWGELKKNKKYKLKGIICRKYNFNYGTGILKLV